MSKAQNWANDYCQLMTQFLNDWQALRNKAEEWEAAGLAALLKDEVLHDTTKPNPLDDSISAADIALGITSIDAIWSWAKQQFHLTNLMKLKVR